MPRYGNKSFVKSDIPGTLKSKKGIYSVDTAAAIGNGIAETAKQASDVITGGVKAVGKQLNIPVQPGAKTRGGKPIVPRVGGASAIAGSNILTDTGYMVRQPRQAFQMFKKGMKQAIDNDPQVQAERAKAKNPLGEVDDTKFMEGIKRLEAQKNGKKNTATDEFKKIKARFKK